MNSAVLLALMFGPLAIYLYVIAVWQSGRSPRVVSGPLDFSLLLFGVGGLLVFGPVGRLLAGRAAAFGTPSVWAWLMVSSALGLLALPWLPRSFRRLAIYNVAPEPLAQALREVLKELPGAFEPTLKGYESGEHQQGLIVETTRWFRAAVVEAYGDHSENLIRRVRSGLNDHLSGSMTRPSPVAWLMLSLCLALILPVLGVLLSRPQAREVFRVLLERLHGG